MIALTRNHISFEVSGNHTAIIIKVNSYYLISTNNLEVDNLKLKLMYSPLFTNSQWIAQLLKN